MLAEPFVPADAGITSRLFSVAPGPARLHSAFGGSTPMNEAERRRLKRQCKELGEQRSQELSAKVAAENPWPVGSRRNGWTDAKNCTGFARRRSSGTLPFIAWKAAVPAVFLANFYVSSDEAAIKYNDSPGEFAERTEDRRITTLELSMLWAIMRGVEWNVALMHEFPCLLQEKDGNWFIHRLAKAMLVDLIRLTPEQIAALAPKWAATQELRWPAHAAHEVIVDIARLARRAEQIGRSVYLWNSL